MAKLATTYNNFSRAKVDHDLMGRFDLPIYSQGADRFDNFLSNFKGNAIYRTGLENMLAFEDCAFIEFKFSNEQEYLCMFTENLVKFLTYDSNGDFGYVQSGGGDLEVYSPYTLAQAKEVQYDQNADVMKMVHNEVAPQDFVRNSASSFSFSDSVTTGADWVVTTEEDIIPTMTSNTTPSGTTISATVNNSDAYKMYDDNNVTFWDCNRTLPVSSTAQKVGSDTVTRYTIQIDNNDDKSPRDWTLSGSNNGSDYTLLDTQTNISWGDNEKKFFTLAVASEYDYHKITITDANDMGDDVQIVEVEFLKEVTTGSEYPTSVQFKDGRLYYSRYTTVWGSEAGDYENFTIPGTILSDSPIKVTLADLTESIEWLFANEKSLICGNAKNIAVINGGDINTAIKADNLAVVITGADGSNGTIPLRKDGLVFYLGRNNRNAYYFSYDLLGESFKADDANFISYDITRGGISKLRYKKDRNDLVYTIRSDGKLLALNFNLTEKIIGWSLHETNGEIKDIATITNNEGDVQLFCLVLRDSVYYVERLADFVEFTPRELFFTGAGDEAKAADDVAYNRFIAEQLKDCIYLDNSQCVENLSTVEITYDSEAGTITADSASFLEADIGKSISYKTITGYESGRFLITAFTSTTVVEVEVIQTPTSDVYSSWYLTFSTISGLDRFDDTDITVVADGGYLGEFPVTSGSIDLDKEVTNACIGLSYTGVIKTFSLGFASQGKNTQITKKSIQQAGLRFVTSAGGRIGSTQYRTTPVQELTPNDINYLPPIPMDGTQLTPYVDDSQEDKYLYIIQDLPLPFTVCAVIINAKYGVE